jgi:spermidine synthase
MFRKAFLLGFFSISAQVLLLRELVASFNGDELFIGIALFGWLISVAAGAGIGGKGNIKVRPELLFFAGIIILLLMMLGVRLSPLAVTSVPGEVIPFSIAALFSVAAMVPVGLISGWLFTSITREERRPDASIVMVYFYEGIGAFVGGLVTASVVGTIYSSLGMCLAVGGIIAGIIIWSGRWGKAISFFLTAGLLILAGVYDNRIDNYLDRIKYRPYTVEASFDTHYCRQTILSKDNTLTLLTDNTVEASLPDLMSSENLLIPPLMYKPEAKRVLYTGRAEFGIMQLADSMPDLRITAVDPRRELGRVLDKMIPGNDNILRVDDDPISFFTRGRPIGNYDIVILNPGDLGSYRNSRLLTDRFLRRVRSSIKKDGLVYIPLPYDTDRYISPEKAELLLIIYNTLGSVFPHVAAWSGEITAFFGSDQDLFNITPDALIGNLKKIGYRAQYVNEDYLYDRLSILKSERLQAVLSKASVVNSMEKPVLPHYQARFRAAAVSTDREVLTLIFESRFWLPAVPGAVIIFFALSLANRWHRRFYGLYLYFIAGFVSLSMELIVFYLHQVMSGSLYLEMAVLIGFFMLGLAMGTYYSYQVGRENLEFPALLLLLTGSVVFWITYDSIPSGALIFYHTFFLFTIAIATGSLFVAATRRYYFGRAGSHRGIGYAVELVGSSLGALMVTTILLPIIGLQWLLVSILIILLSAFAGAILTVR